MMHGGMAIWTLVGVALLVLLLVLIAKLPRR